MFRLSARGFLIGLSTILGLIPGTPVQAQKSSGVTKISKASTAPNLIHTPAADYTGNDSFTFDVTDNMGLSSPDTTVSITVTSNQPPVAPVANEQSVTTTTNTAKIITLTCNESNSSALTYTIVTPPEHGALSGTAPDLIYTPAANYTGSDLFTFNVTNSKGVSSAIATIFITVLPVDNHPPVANAQDVTTTQNTTKAITLTATDPDGDTLTYAIVTPPEHGTLSGTAPDLIYTPAADYTGSDSFTFDVTDNMGLSSPDTTVFITVTSNQEPVANDQNVITGKNLAKAITLTGSDTSSNALTYTIGTPPEHGTLMGTAPNLIYTPAQDYIGSDSFTFDVTNNLGVSSPDATITITVSESVVLYSQSGTDPAWSEVYSHLNQDGSASPGPVDGSTIDVNNDQVETSAYAKRPVEDNLSLHIPCNKSTGKLDAFTRWYQQDGNTQVFRMFKDDNNTVGNPPRFSTRVEAFAPKKSWKYSDNKIFQWTGRFTIAEISKGCGFSIFQARNDVNDWGIMVCISSGKLQINKRRQTPVVVYSSIPKGFSFDLKVEDDGENYRCWINDVLMASGSWARPTSTTKFRWGMYLGHNALSREVAMVFVSGATITSRSGHLR